MLQGLYVMPETRNRTQVGHMSVPTSSLLATLSLWPLYIYYIGKAVCPFPLANWMYVESYSYKLEQNTITLYYKSMNPCRCLF